jgi:uncharacterized protein YqhQ
MMRNRERMAIAVRRPDGGIEVRTEPMGAAYRSRWASWPFVRGLFTLYDSLVIGMRALMFSADVSAGEEVELSGPMMWGTMGVSLALGVGLFFALPALLTSLVESMVDSAWVTNMAEGIVRLLLFLGYVVAISRIPDIQRVFAYHGAEHKVINAYEAGEPLEVEAVLPYSVTHTRCGTAFLLIVVLVSILVFGFLGRPPLLLLLASRLVLVPVIVSFSYELVRLASKHSHNPLARLLVSPALKLQTLTTRPPTEDMIEVALTALSNVLEPATEVSPTATAGAPAAAV